VRLGSIGIWSNELRFGDPGKAVEVAAELDELGFGALWIPDIGGPVFERAGLLLGAAGRAVVATGIVNIWMHDAGDVAAAHARLDLEHPERFLLGLGIGHAHQDVGAILEPAERERMELDFAALAEAQDRGGYGRPLAAMRAYLDALDESAAPGSTPARVLAALAPRMVALAGERTLGVHPYLMPVAHTRLVREALGPEPLVAPELTVTLQHDRALAHASAREDLQLYLRLPNYVNSWKRLGYDDAELTAGGSDRLIDALYAWGSAEEIARRVREHHEAGANHVCLRVVGQEWPLAEWRELAGLLSLSTANG
jgi:probable F420-dependent oxidoreductase